MSKHKYQEGTVEDLLATSPFEDEPDFSPVVAPGTRNAGWPKSTVLLGSGVLLVAGFFGGIQANKTWGAQSSQGNRQATALGAGQGAFGGYGGARRSQSQTGQTGALPAGGGTVGTIKLIDGDKIYLDTLDGGTVTVKTSGSTRIQISKAGKLADLKPGATVIVQGQSGADGTVNATSVNEGGIRGGQ